MKISIIGGGPGGLYTAILCKKAKPEWDVSVFERNGVDDTFGFGVVFSDETLSEFLQRDLPFFESMKREFAYWDDVAIHYKGQEMRIAGNGFCGTSRRTLLSLLQARCMELGVVLHHGVDIQADRLAIDFSDSDVIVAADGINSAIREHYKDQFQPKLSWKSNHFCWMGSTRPMADAFNYFFKETEYGIMVAHCYQYNREHSTWVIEMDDATWQGHGFAQLDEVASAHALERIFAAELQGHPLLTNRSNWRRFPRIFCERWHTDNIVILGDAKASAHFSIGSGTKLAMECGIALADALIEHAQTSVNAAFEAYDAARRAPVEIIQHNADVSLAWFEHMGRAWDMEPYQFAMVVMCRAKSVTYDNVLLRDADFVKRVDDEWYARHWRQTGQDLRYERPTPMFAALRLRDLVLNNRVVMAPMAQYMADVEGNLTDWHFSHYTSHAMGGMGLMFTEMTCVSPQARITEGCPGLWSDAQEQAWARMVNFVHTHSETKVACQLGHAGRKGATQLGWERADQPLVDRARRWPLVAASALPWLPLTSDMPAALDEAGMAQITADFVAATQRAQRAGFDLLELHCAHGYLLASFLSPLTNGRSDAYGGTVENRLRFPLAVFRAMRDAWPAHKPMSVRLSGTDWHDDGVSEDDLIAIARAFADAGCDLIDVSAGQTVPDQKPVYGRMFQVQFAEAVRNLTGVATMAVGNITEAAQINTIVHTRRADLVAVGRAHLSNPFFTHQAAAGYGVRRPTSWPRPYLSGADQAWREGPKIREKQQELQRKAKPSSHGEAST